MISLKDLDLKFKYRLNKDKLNIDFYEKCLNVSSKYDRAVGYFTSSSLLALGQGLKNFTKNNGKIRIVANPLLSEEDYNAILRGEKAKENIIEKALLRELSFCEDKSLKNNEFSTLSYLISEGILEIKIAFSKDNSLYHEKFGIFYDAYGNKVSFSGSANETLNGLTSNFEKIDVYFGENELFRINDMVDDFENLWNNTTENLTIIDVPNIILSKIVNLNKNSNYKKEVKPREYQLEAIKSFKDNQWKGIFEMATGTGKTITSLLITKEYKKEKSRMFLIILVPFTHLVEQWISNCRLLGYKQILKCYGNKSSWIRKLENKIRDFNIGISDLEVIITTYKSASSIEFNDLISCIKNNSFIIGDECHYFGIKSLTNNKFENINARLGLSATPDRWWDETGTDNLRRYFGKTVYEYGMGKAIENEILTEYKYNPVVCDLNESEMLRYEKITRQVQKLMLKEKKTYQEKEDIEKLNRKRSLILAKAKSKINILIELLKKEDIKNLKHTLVYCAPGDIDNITKLISDLGIRVYRFDSKVKNNQRSKLLERFNQGDIQILIAMKCLDEGVDIPATKKAFFLASTSNPREFIQRRGRILRKSPNKNLAIIYDFIVIPSQAKESIYTTIIKKEMPRFAEFSKYAINKYDSRMIIKQYLEIVNLEYLMDKLPWEVYRELQEEFGNE